MKSELDILSVSKHTDINVSVGALFVYHSSDFFQIISRALSSINTVANSKYNPPSSFKSNLKVDSENDHEILESKGINEQT